MQAYLLKIWATLELSRVLELIYCELLFFMLVKLGPQLTLSL